MKGCILEVHFEGQDFYHFIDSNHGAGLSLKKVGWQKQRGGGEFWKLFLLGGGKTTHLAVERVCLGDQGKGKIIKINYEKNFIHTSCQKCSLHFKSSLHWLLQVYCITRKMHISQELTFFGSPLSVTRHNFSALFYLKLFILWTKRAHQNSNFRNCDCSHEN